MLKICQVHPETDVHRHRAISSNLLKYGTVTMLLISHVVNAVGNLSAAVNAITLDSTNPLGISDLNMHLNYRRRVWWCIEP
jgi:hypothetical protein